MKVTYLLIETVISINGNVIKKENKNISKYKNLVK
jgi:hypothetical protein